MIIIIIIIMIIIITIYLFIFKDDLVNTGTILIPYKLLIILKLFQNT
jgi:hypothetical protein